MRLMGSILDKTDSGLMLVNVILIVGGTFILFHFTC